MNHAVGNRHTTVLDEENLPPKEGLLLRYRLLLRDGVFHVEVCAADAAGVRCVTSGGMRTLTGARRFFRLVVAHTVTPYTLDAVYDEQAEIL